MLNMLALNQYFVVMTTLSLDKFSDYGIHKISHVQTGRQLVTVGAITVEIVLFWCGTQSQLWSILWLTF